MLILHRDLMSNLSSVSVYSERLLEYLIDCDSYNVKLVLDEAKVRLGLECVLAEVIPFALNVLGEKWSSGEVALMQVYAASKIAEQEITRLSEGLKTAVKIKHKVVIGSLDSHGLGKNIVARFLKASGVEVVDLGIEVTPEVFVETAIKEQAEAILISALMFNTSIRAKRVRELMDSADLRIPLMVGGAPYNFDAGLWRRMGADATSKNVLEAALELEEVLAKWNRMKE